MQSKLEQPEIAQSEERKTKRAIDLRSDTVTQPTPEMRRAMAEAEVADDVYGEDPTMNRLTERTAQIFQKEAAIFVPSGTMGNQVAIRCHTQHGQEIICEERAHFINLESATVAAFSGCQPRTIYGEDGVITWAQIKKKIAPPAYYRAQTGLIELENTGSLTGGTVFPQDVADEICDGAHELGLPVHLDGARIFNAATAMKKVGGGDGAQIRFGHVLPVERAVRAGGIDAGGKQGVHRQGPRLSQSHGRRHAPSRRAGGGRIDCAGEDAGAFAGRP